jgi:hypothetical protein
MNRFFATLLLSFALGLPSFAAAGITAAPAVDAGNPGARDDWVNRIRKARDGLTRARLRYDQAVRDYGRMRSRRKARGAKKEAMLQEHDAAMEALSKAERQLEELLHSARRAGVPPGWIREAMDDRADEAANQD